MILTAWQAVLVVVGPRVLLVSSQLIASVRQSSESSRWMSTSHWAAWRLFGRVQIWQSLRNLVETQRFFLATYKTQNIDFLKLQSFRTTGIQNSNERLHFRSTEFFPFGPKQVRKPWEVVFTRCEHTLIINDDSSWRFLRPNEEPRKCWPVRQGPSLETTWCLDF